MDSLGPQNGNQKRQPEAATRNGNQKWQPEAAEMEKNEWGNFVLGDT
jgi:hypothetical protein